MGSSRRAPGGGRIMIRDRSGFTIVEVVIAMALLGVIALVMTQLSTQTAKSAKGVGVTTEAINVINGIEGILANPDACVRAMQGMFTGVIPTTNPDVYCSGTPCVTAVLPPSAPPGASIYTDDPSTPYDDRYIDDVVIHNPRQ